MPDRETGRVYVVDDDRDVGSALTRLLRAEGFEAEVYPSALSFLDRHATCPEGCLILDINMPDMSGRTLQRLLRGRGWPLPVIYITGYPFPGGEDAALADGARALLAKPVDPDALIAEINNALAGML